jgi:hypothetical protein
MRITPGPAMHADLAFWRALAHGHEGSRFQWEVPLATLVGHTAVLGWTSDASLDAIGGCCERTGMWWVYHLTEEQRARTNRSKRAADRLSELHINGLELTGMVITTYVMVVRDGYTVPPAGGVVKVRGANQVAVEWVKRAHGSTCQATLAAHCRA